LALPVTDRHATNGDIVSGYRAGAGRTGHVIAGGLPQAILPPAATVDRRRCALAGATSG